MADMYGKGKERKAKILFSKLIRLLAICENCGDTDKDKHQCAHIITRKINITHTDLRNAFCLCASCHAYFTQDPVAFGRFVDRTWAKQFYDEIQQRSRLTQKGTDAFWQERIDFLQDIYDRILEGELTIQEARLYETA